MRDRLTYRAARRNLARIAHKLNADSFREYWARQAAAAKEERERKRA